MLIDCDSCTMRDIACEDCVVTVILGRPPALEFDQDESLALVALAKGGLVPHLQLVQDPHSDKPREITPSHRRVG